MQAWLGLIGAIAGVVVAQVLALVTKAVDDRRRTERELKAAAFVCLDRLLKIRSALSRGEEKQLNDELHHLGVDMGRYRDSIAAAGSGLRALHWPAHKRMMPILLEHKLDGLENVIAGLELVSGARKGPSQTAVDRWATLTFDSARRRTTIDAMSHDETQTRPASPAQANLKTDADPARTTPDSGPPAQVLSAGPPTHPGFAREVALAWFKETCALFHLWSNTRWVATAASVALGITMYREAVGTAATNVPVRLAYTVVCFLDCLFLVGFTVYIEMETMKVWSFMARAEDRVNALAGATVLDRARFERFGAKSIAMVPLGKVMHVLVGLVVVLAPQVSLNVQAILSPGMRDATVYFWWSIALGIIGLVVLVGALMVHHKVELNTKAMLVPPGPGATTGPEPSDVEAQ